MLHYRYFHRMAHTDLCKHVYKLIHSIAFHAVPFDWRTEKAIIPYEPTAADNCYSFEGKKMEQFADLSAHL